MELPNCICCYFPIESGIKFLKTLKFRLFSISRFNDPFESLFVTGYPYFFLSFDEKSDDYMISKRVDQMQRYRFPNKKIITNKATGFVNLMKDLRIGCFSETPDNILMWGHYARQFTGIVVKFRTAITDWGYGLEKVKYNDTRIAVDSFKSDVIGSTSVERSLLTRKSVQWAYEKEWRYIRLTNDCDKDKEGCYKKFEKAAIEEVIVGCRISPKHLATIKRINENIYDNKISLKVIMPAKSKYALKIWGIDSVEFALMWNNERPASNKKQNDSAANQSV